MAAESDGTRDDRDSRSTPSSLKEINESLSREYTRKQRLLSFDEYFELVTRDPVRHARNSAQYIKDAFDHFGSYTVHRPGGPRRRFKLFDCEFDKGRDRLIGHEPVQNRVYNILESFVRQGHANRLLLLHGPNGSAKSTFVEVLSRALKHYSMLEEGATYRFNWIFPVGRLTKGGIGFSSARKNAAPKTESYAHLPDELVEARLTDELRDNPLLLIPSGRRRAVLERLLEQTGASDHVLSDYIMHGDLNHRNRQIFEALLAAYHGDYEEVLRHVQVERYFMSRRYRNGLVTVEPKMAVDARTRQLTMDQNLSTLPPVLQHLELFAYSGELVDANRGLVEFSDLLKRPVEAFKYLVNMVEQGRTNLEGALLYTDTVFFGSTNELHLAAFRELPDFPSFRGRLELVRVPYLLDHRVESEIYSSQITPRAAGKHIGPHAIEIASLWAVLTRLHRPSGDHYPAEIKDEVSNLTTLEKSLFYAQGLPPASLEGEKLKVFQNALRDMVTEYDDQQAYEGSTGASPRAILSALLNALQQEKPGFLSPLAVLDELQQLTLQTSLYEFLKRPKQPQGFFDSDAAVEEVARYLREQIEMELWEAVGLVDEAHSQTALERYVAHVSSWVKKEKIRNPVTGKMEDPDQAFMNEMEKQMTISQEPEKFREDIITRVAAWAISHRDEKPALSEIFARELKQFKDQAVRERRQMLNTVLRHVLSLIEHGDEPLEGKEQVEAARAALKNLTERFGYTQDSAREAIGFYLRESPQQQ